MDPRAQERRAALPPIPEQAKKERKTPPALRPEQIAESKFSPEEKARRARAAWDSDRAAEACERLENILYHRVIDRGGGGSKEVMESIALRKLLMEGEVVGQRPVGEPGVNVTEILTLLDTRLEGEGKQVKVIAKPASGEKSFAYDSATKDYFVVSKKTKSMGEMQRVRTKPVDQLKEERDFFIQAGNPPEAVDASLARRRSVLSHEAAKIEQDTEDFPSFARGLAKEYGVHEKTIIGLYLEDAGVSAKEIEDLWLAGDEAIKAKLELTYRKGQPAGGGHAREFVFSQVDKLFGFGVVPETVLKAERDKTGKPQEVMSLQHMATAREMTDDELIALGSIEASDPRAKQLMRIAALDFLLGATDRHGGNILVDKKSGSLIAIDNAYSMGLSHPGSTKELRQSGVLEEGQFATPDQQVSVAMEFADHSGMELDEEALAGIRDFYEKTSLYLSERPKYKQLSEKYKSSPSLMTADELALYQKMETVGEYPKYMTDLFRLAFRSDGSDPDREKIVQAELAGFMERCAYVLKHKKLPPAHYLMGFGGLKRLVRGHWPERKGAPVGAPNPFSAVA
jgi:hypothetical protein